MARVSGRDVIYDAAQLWKDECLIGDGSMFGAGALWTEEHLDELDRHFIQNPDASSDSFGVKLQRQLDAASPRARRLAAELLWVLMLFPINAGAPAKTRLVTTAWSWSGNALDASDDLLVDVFRQGIGSAGTAFMTGRWRELVFLIRWAQAIKALAPADRTAVLADPWRTAELTATVSEAGQRQMRHIVLHLLFPDAFEPIASGGNRRQILAAFQPEIAEAGPPAVPYSDDATTRADQQLLQIRRVLEARSPARSATSISARGWSDGGTWRMRTRPYPWSRSPLRPPWCGKCPARRASGRLPRVRKDDSGRNSATAA